MQFLKLLESVRTPFWDALFSAVTHLGEEKAFIVMGIFLYWCWDKCAGFYLLLVSFTGTICNQFLKITVRMPRPFERDPTLTIVESARAQALGFSFPSGHSQNAVSLFGAVAVCRKNTAVRIVCCVLCALVLFSRLYLGVHTPADVLVGGGIAALLLLVLYRPSQLAMTNGRVLAVLLAAMVLLGAALVLYAEQFPFPMDSGVHYLNTGVETAWTLFGAAIGFALGLAYDYRRLHFDVKAVWWAQILKFTLGLALLFGIRSGLKALFAPIGHPATNALRYCCMLLFASAVWPMTFPFFARLGKKQ